MAGWDQPVMTLALMANKCHLIVDSVNVNRAILVLDAIVNAQKMDSVMKVENFASATGMKMAATWERSVR